ncbi:MAG: hypothetical protein KBT34_02975 [Prevotella sp.]|nr:hypothetical protein [Candidatus Prevotella equi]
MKPEEFGVFLMRILLTKHIVKIKKLSEEAFIPERITKGSAAYDAKLPRDYKLEFGRQILPLDIAMSMPEYLYLDSRTRAGYAAKGILAYDKDGKEYRLDADLILGLIDSDYTDAIGAIVHVRDERVKYLDLYVHRGQAIGQLNFGFRIDTIFEEVEELEETERKGGYGKMNGE